MELKVNAVVSYNKDEGGWIPFGRVWKILPDGRCIVIFCTKHIAAHHPEDLDVHDYKGRWDHPYSERRQKYPVWIPMASLRRLKQMCSGYHPDIWKKKRPPGTLPYWTTDGRTKERIGHDTRLTRN